MTTSCRPERVQGGGEFAWSPISHHILYISGYPIVNSTISASSMIYISLVEVDIVYNQIVRGTTMKTQM